MYVTQNRNDILHKLYGESFSSTGLSKNVSDQSIHSNWSMDKSKNILPPLRMEKHIQKCEWDKIVPCKAVYQNRSYEILKPGWADIIYEQIWKQIKIPCALHFKNAKINRILGEIFLKISGKCSECNNKINICSITEPTVEGIRLHISTYDTRDVVHTKKRQLRGKNRKRVVKEVLEKSVYTWRRDEANKLMNFGDPISSLVELKYSLEFAGSIRQISIDKFYIMYWSPEQIFLYKQFIKCDKIGSISIDATDSLIKSLLKPDNSKTTIFLYQIVASLNGKILPICQMASEKHDANMLTFWMREWLRSSVPYPREVVTDYSLALLNAVSLSFNNNDLQTYVNNCMTMLLSSNTRKRLINCVIRIDIAHLIKLVCRWPCFSHTPTSVKDFFVRCVGILSKCTTITDFSSLCTDVLSVSFSSLEDAQDVNNHCYSAQCRLLHIMKTDTGIFNIADDSDLLVTFMDSEDDTDIPSDIEIYKFLQIIEKNSKKENDGNRPNPYYCPDFGTRLLKLCKHFVLWTAVMSTIDVENNSSHMRKTNLVATSARSKEYFREVKHLIFNDAKSTRVDKFIILHLRSLAGTMKLLNALNNFPSSCEIKSNSSPIFKNEKNDFDISYDRHDFNDFPDNSKCSILSEDKQHTSLKTDDDKNNSQISDDALHDTQANSFLFEEESWKGLNQIKKTRGKYLTACPDIENVHKRPRCNRNVPLLINGNCLPPAKIGEKRFMIRNTCPFDATIQCIIGGYRDWPQYNKYISELSNPTCELIKYLYNKGVTQKTYDMRAAIMHSVVRPKDGTLDCAMNIGALISTLMHNVPSLEVIYQCNNCEFYKRYTTSILDVSTIPFYKHGIRGLQEAVDQKRKITGHICTQCDSGQVNVTYINKNHIFIDIECVGNEQLASNHGWSNTTKEFTLAELPTDLYLCGEEYRLVGAIIFISGERIGHYIAYIRKITGKWEMHDGLSKKTQLVTTRALLQKRNVHILFYVKT